MVLLFFFFKQKTAYDMRISDWSSDVCSSDLIADAVLRLRACHFSLTVRDRDIAARELELAVTRERLAHGNVAPVEAANATSNLATARTDRISQQEACARIVNELVALGGRAASVVRSLVMTPASSSEIGRA